MAPRLDQRLNDRSNDGSQPILRPSPAKKVTARSSRASSRVRVSMDKSSRRLPSSNLINDRRPISRGRPVKGTRAGTPSVARPWPSKAPATQDKAAGLSKSKRPSGFRQAYLRMFKPGPSHKEQLEIARSQEQVSALQFALSEAAQKIQTRDERISKCEKEIKRLRRNTRALEVDQGMVTLIADPKELTLDLPKDAEDKMALLRKQALKINELESRLRISEAANSRRQPATLDRPHFESQLKSLQRELELNRQASGQTDVVFLPSDTDSTLTDSSQKRINKKLKLQLQKSQVAYHALRESIAPQAERQLTSRQPLGEVNDYTFSTSNKGKAPQIEANAARRRTVKPGLQDGLTDSTQMPKDAEFNVQQAKLLDTLSDLEASRLALAESITAREKLESKLRSSKRLLRKALIEAEKTAGLKSPTPLDGAPRIAHDLAAANEQIHQLTRSMRESSEARESMKARLDSAQLELTRLTADIEKRDTSTEELERHLTTLETAWNSTDGLQQRSRLSAEVRIAELSAQVDKHTAMKAELTSIASELDELSIEVAAIKGLKGEVKTLRKENRRLSDQVLRNSLMGAYEIAIIEEAAEGDVQQFKDDGSSSQGRRSSHFRSKSIEGDALSRELDDNRYSAVELSTAVAQAQQNFVNIKVHETVKARLTKAEGRLVSMQEENRILLDAKRESNLAIAQMRESLATGAETLRADPRIDELQSQLQASQSQLQEQKQSNVELEAELVKYRQLREEKEALQGEYDRTLRDLQSFAETRLALDAAEDTINTMRRDLKEYEDLKKTNEILQAERDTQQRVNRDLQQLSVESREGCDAQAIVLEHLKVELEQSQTEVSRLELVAHEITSARGEVGELSMQLRNTTSYLEANSLELAQAKDVASRLQAELHEAEAENGRALLNAARLEELVVEMQAQKELTNKQLDAAQKQQNELAAAKDEELGILKSRLVESESAAAALVELKTSRAELEATLRDLEAGRSSDRERAKLQVAELSAQIVSGLKHVETLSNENTEMRSRLQQIDKLKAQVNEGRTRSTQLEVMSNESQPASPTDLALLTQELGMHESARRPSIDSSLSDRPMSAGDRPMSASSIRSDDSDAYRKRLAAANWQLQEAKTTNKHLLDRLGRRDKRDENTQDSLRKSRIALERAQKDLALLASMKTQKAASEALVHELESEVARLNKALDARNKSPNRQVIVDTAKVTKERDDLQDELKFTQAALNKHLQESDTVHEALQTQLSAFDTLSEQLDEMSRELQISRENEADLRSMVDKYVRDDRSISSEEADDTLVQDDDEETLTRRARNFALQLESIKEEDGTGDWARSNYDHRDRVTPDDDSSISSSTVSVDADTRQLEEDMLGEMYAVSGADSAASPRKPKTRPTIDLGRAKNPLEHQLEEETPRSSAFSPTVHVTTTAALLSPVSDQLSVTSASSRPDSSTGSSQDSEHGGKLQGRPKPVSRSLADRVMHYETLSQRVERKRREELANENFD